MLLDWPNWLIAVANIVFIPCIHLGLSYWANQRPLSFFQGKAWLSRVYSFEARGEFYEKFFFIRLWKEQVPDAAPWMQGFEKKRLRSRDPEYLQTFHDETIRSEASHWLQLISLLLLLLWNPMPFAAPIILGYAVSSNLPCIVLQRYNRLRFRRLLDKTCPIG